MSAATFEDYRREHGIADDDPALWLYRQQWEIEAEAERHRPATMPPCPEWCLLPAGHDYDSIGGHPISLERQHVAFSGRLAVGVDATERCREGEVVVEQPVAIVDMTDLDRPVEDLRAAAAELVEAAETLERLTR